MANVWVKDLQRCRPSGALGCVANLVVTNNGYKWMGEPLRGGIFVERGVNART